MLQLLSPHTAATEAHTPQLELCTAIREAQAKQRRPSTDKRKVLIVVTAESNGGNDNVKANKTQKPKCITQRLKNRQEKSLKANWQS